MINRSIGIILVLLLSVSDIFLFRQGLIPIEPTRIFIPLLLFLFILNYSSMIKNLKKVNFIITGFFLISLFLAVIFSSISTYDEVYTKIFLSLISLFIFLFSSLYFNQINRANIKVIFIISIIILSGSIIYDYLTVSDFDFQRAAGFAENPNSASSRILAISIIILCLINKKFYKFLFALFVFLIVFITLSRSSLLLYFILFGILLISRFEEKINFKLLTINFPLFIFLTYILIIFNSNIIRFVSDKLNLNSISATERIDKISSGFYNQADLKEGGRINVIFEYLEIANNKILGYGTGMSNNRSLYKTSTHNVFLRYLIDYGFFGFIILLIFSLTYLYRSFISSHNYVFLMSLFFISLFFFDNNILENRTFLISLAAIEALKYKKN